TPEPPTPTPTPEAPTATPEPTPTQTPTPMPSGITVTAVLSLADLKLSVTGSGWAPRERLVVELSDQPDGTRGQRLAAIRADTRGKFAITVTLESAPEPSESLYVVVRSRDRAERKVIAPVEIISPP
ncbi:MAG: hypothetical protein RMM31_08270, partial [Anaerolineae bacterium]|nr:hypothetical protein [Anaerolineae bacterium]